MKWNVVFALGLVTQLYVSVGDALGILPSLMSVGSSVAQAAPRDPKAKPSKKAKATKAAKSKSALTKKAIDYNAPGVAAFKKGDFAEAVSKFEIATKKDGKNPLSWFNHARAIIALNAGHEPSDYCDSEKNWILNALSSLSSAWILDRKKTGVLISGNSDPSFKPFLARPEYKKWIQLQRLPLKTDLATQEFFAQNNDWLIPNASLPSTIVTFAPSHEIVIAKADGDRDTGRWSAGADRVLIKTKQSQRTLNLTNSPRAFGSSGRSYQQVVLKDPTNGETWSIGPEIADCPN